MNENRKVLGMNIGKTVVFFSIAAVSHFLAAETATWIATGANTPDTAYLWSDAANWQDGKVGGAGDDIVLPNESVYIRVPDSGITVRRLQNLSSTAYVIGGDIRLLSAGEGTEAERRAILETEARIHCDIVIPEEETLNPYFKGISANGSGYHLCGRIRNESSSGVYPEVTDGSVSHHFCYFANVGGATRTEDMVSEGPFGINGGAAFFIAPEGGDAASGSWKLTAGSPYATRQSASHRLAVGTAVAGGGLPEGTFLKRVFNDATIELSEPAPADGTVQLSFAAMTTDFTLTLGSRFLMHGNYCNLFFYKSRNANKARLEINDFNTLSKFKTIEAYLGNNGTTPCGTFVFHTVSGGGVFKFIDIRHAHLEFAGDETGVTAFSDNQPFTMKDKQSALMTVTNNITGVISVLSNFHGTITKDGAGQLQVGLGKDIAEGSLVVEGGVLKLTRKIPAEAGALAIASLTIKAGATVELPEGGLSVSNLVLEDGAVLRGDATLTVLDGTDRVEADPRRLTCMDGARVAYALLASGGETVAAGSAALGAYVKDGEGTVRLDGLAAETLAVHAGTVTVAKLDRASAVPAGAWLHVDATDESSIVLTNAKSYAVHSWSDVNGTGRQLRSIRQQRDTTSTGWPLYKPSSTTINNLPCIDLGKRQTGSSAGLVVFEPDGKISPGQDKNYSVMEAPPLRTSFLVYDSTDGGGALMGGVGGECYAKGIPHRFHFQASGETAAALHTVPICGDPTLTAYNNLIHTKAISNACVNGTGIFLRDGERINPCTAYFKQGPERMALRYPSGLKCAVFGAYGGSGIRGDYFGGLKYGEIICFERSLTDYEFRFIDAYLAKKWFNRDTLGYGAPFVTNLQLSAGAVVKLPDGVALAAKNLAGGGKLDGSLSLLPGGGITADVAADGTFASMQVTGSADLSTGGALTLSGAVNKLTPGLHALLESGSLTTDGEWSVQGGNPTRKYSVIAQGNTLYLNVRLAGFGILVR